MTRREQLRLAGTLGQRFLAQQMELEERISQLNDLEAAKTSANDDDPVENEIQEQTSGAQSDDEYLGVGEPGLFGGLANKCIRLWLRPKQLIERVLKPMAHHLRPYHALLQQSMEDPSVMSSPSSGPSVAQSSRRAEECCASRHDVVRDSGISWSPRSCLL